MSKKIAKTELAKEEGTLDMSKPFEYQTKLTISMDDIIEHALFTTSESFEADIAALKEEQANLIEVMKANEENPTEFLEKNLLPLLDIDLDGLKDTFAKLIGSKVKFTLSSDLTLINAGNHYRNSFEISLSKENKKALVEEMSNFKLFSDCSSFFRTFDDLARIELAQGVIRESHVRYGIIGFSRKEAKQFCKSVMLQNKAMVPDKLLNLMVEQLREYTISKLDPNTIEHCSRNLQHTSDNAIMEELKIPQWFCTKNQMEQIIRFTNST